MKSLATKRRLDFIFHDEFLCNIMEILEEGRKINVIARRRYISVYIEQYHSDQKRFFNATQG
jgi:hypothetical protein